jgi:hypothetical protein
VSTQRAWARWYVDGRHFADARCLSFTWAQRRLWWKHAFEIATNSRYGGSVYWKWNRFPYGWRVRKVVDGAS